jgi:hypothetical protein
MPLWEKVIYVLVAYAAFCLWMAYDVWMHPVCVLHQKNCCARRKHLFSRWAWCEKGRITFVPR